jgi:hypothetical protein
MRYYLYRHVRHDTNEVFYIGIGTKRHINRIYSQNTEYSRAYEKYGRSDYWKNIVAKTTYTIEIIMESNDKNFICQKEIEFIKLYGKKYDNKGTLVNFADGGNGASGIKNYNIKIRQLTLENEVVKIWDQLKDIEKELGYLKTNVVKCCRKKQLTAYGYKWEYVDSTEYDNIYPTTARKKSHNNRVGIYVTNGTETLLFRTIGEVAKKYGYHRSTIQAYLNNKRQHKFLKFEYAKWN